MSYRKQNQDGTWTVFNGRHIVTEDATIINPTEAVLLANGYEPFEPAPIIHASPSNAAVLGSILSLVRVQAEALDDAAALECMAVFPTFNSLLGQAVEVGRRVWYDNGLYKVAQAHTVSAEWAPANSPALWRNVSQEVQPADGSLQSPYAWESGMTSEAGKYYSEGGATYLCTRDSGSPLYYPIADLVGAYFEAVG